jgi:hypothetical protein
MSVFDKFKKRVPRQARSGAAEPERTQFNIFVKPNTKDTVRALAGVYKSTIYAVAEHCIDIGSAYMVMALEDKEEKARLTQHLTTRHLLGMATGDEAEYLAGSVPVFSKILQPDIEALYEEFLDLEYLVFKVKNMPDKEWSRLIAECRLNLKGMFIKLRIKVNRLIKYGTGEDEHKPAGAEAEAEVIPFEKEEDFVDEHEDGIA